MRQSARLWKICGDHCRYHLPRGGFPADIEAWEQAPAEVDGMMAVTAYVDDEKPLWVETGEGMDIVAFRDTPWSGAKYVSGGIYGLRPEGCRRA